jgi:hypothetical protein
MTVELSLEDRGRGARTGDGFLAAARLTSAATVRGRGGCDGASGVGTRAAIMVR